MWSFSPGRRGNINGIIQKTKNASLNCPLLMNLFHMIKSIVQGGSLFILALLCSVDGRSQTPGAAKQKPHHPVHHSGAHPAHHVVHHRAGHASGGTSSHGVHHAVNHSVHHTLPLAVDQGPSHVPSPIPYGAIPTERQLRWQEMEMYCIIHFGVNTYLDHEWGYGDEDPNLINPIEFNAAQIVGAVKAGGFKGIVVVAKHHDGLCLWPTATTNHSISFSKWKHGKGDMVKEYQLACGKLGIRLGLYCSPWDRNSALYGTAAYVKMYRAQLKELYSRYGNLFMSWHDGANGGDGYYGGAREARTIDRSTYYGWDTTWALTRSMQPGACIFGDIGPDVRWVGNEQGHAGQTYWATYTPIAPDSGHVPSNGYVVSELGTEGTRDGKYWMPAECDVPLRPGWFYHAGQDAQVKSPSALLDLYYASVGRGADLDLGIAPDKRGLLNEHDVASLKEFGYLLRETFKTNLAVGAHMTTTNIRGRDVVHYGPHFLLDDSRYSYWATDDSIHTAEIIFDMTTPKTFDVIRLRENIKLGQRIDSFAVDIPAKDGSWQELVRGTSIGANKLLRLDQAVTTRKVRLRILGAPVAIALSDFGLYKEPYRIAAPLITRSFDGTVRISTEDQRRLIRFTLDGSAPNSASPLYTGSFDLPNGGLVRAAQFTEGGLAGEISTARFGIRHTGWKVLEASAGAAGAGAVGSSGNAVGATAAAAIDGDPHTLWNTLSSGDTLPQHLSIDLGQAQTIAGFSYLPRQDKGKEGLVTDYSFAVSDDGLTWKEVKTGEFSNIVANPLEQWVKFDQPVTTRFIRFTALRVSAGSGVAVSALGVWTR